MFPTYNSTINSSQRLDGVNEADEMNLYNLNPLLDSPYGPADLEWLYRSQDVDGANMTSRLSQLAPVFTNTIDGQRRRRLYALHSFETNNFAWTTDNPGGAFGNNARFTSTRRAPAGPFYATVFGNLLARFPSRRWPTATRRSTSITPCRSPMTPTSRSGRSGSATPTSSSS